MHKAPIKAVAASRETTPGPVCTHLLRPVRYAAPRKVRRCVSGAEPLRPMVSLLWCPSHPPVLLDHAHVGAPDDRLCECCPVNGMRGTAHHPLQQVRFAPQRPPSQKTERGPLCAADGLTLRIHQVCLQRGHCRSAAALGNHAPLSQQAHHALQHVRFAPSRPPSQETERGLLSAATGFTLRIPYVYLTREHCRSAAAHSQYARH